MEEMIVKLRKENKKLREENEELKEENADLESSSDLYCGGIYFDLSRSPIFKTAPIPNIRGTFTDVSSARCGGVSSSKSAASAGILGFGAQRLAFWGRRPPV